MTQNTGVQLLEVGKDSDDQRIDNFLSSRLKGVPRSHLYRLIRKGEIRVNKKRIKPDSRVHAGDMVRVAPLRLPDAAAPMIPGEALTTLLKESILWENPGLMVINKPQGLAVHAGSGQSSGLIEALRHIHPQHEYLELVHRIDKETSGCVLVAKNAKVLKHLQNEIKARKLHKTYLALVHGAWPEQLEEIDAPLHKQSAEAGSGIVTVREDGKASLTRFAVIKRYRGASLIHAMPITGRTHQIRVHCQFAGYPIVGDSKYTPRSRPPASSPLALARHLCLHAARLNFSLPERAKRVNVEAAMGSTMAAMISRLEPL